MRKFAYFVLALFLIGCGNGDNNRDQVTNFRFVNAVPDATALDLLIDYEPVLSNVRFRESSGYFNIDSGRIVIQVSESGSFSPLVDTTTSLADNIDYTLIACGPTDNSSSVLLRDDNDPGNGETTKIRVVNVAKNTGSVDVYVNTPGTNIGSVSPSAESLGYKQVTGYLRSTPGAYSITVTAKNSKSIITSLQAEALKGKSVYTFIIVDPASGSNASVLALTDRE